MPVHDGRLQVLQHRFLTHWHLLHTHPGSRDVQVSHDQGGESMVEYPKWNGEVVVMSYEHNNEVWKGWKLKKEKITPPSSDSASPNELQLCEEPSLLSTLPVATIARHAIAHSSALYLLVLRCSHSWVLHGAYSGPLAQSPVRAHWEKSNDFHSYSVELEFHLWKFHLEMVQKEPLLEVM